MTQTFEEAKAAHDECVANGRDAADPTLPLYQWNALQQIAELENAFGRGDKMALFAAVRKCANHDLVMPDWVSRAFIRGYDAVLTCSAASWDEAFGRPYPKGMHLANVRESRTKRFAIWLRVSELRDIDRLAIDDAIFERVGKEFGVGKTRANKLYYEAERMLPRKS